QLSVPLLLIAGAATLSVVIGTLVCTLNVAPLWLLNCLPLLMASALMVETRLTVPLLTKINPLVIVIGPPLPVKAIGVPTGLLSVPGPCIVPPAKTKFAPGPMVNWPPVCTSKMPPLLMVMPDWMVLRVAPGAVVSLPPLLMVMLELELAV